MGVDLLAIQAPSCRGRGIGRYAKSLLRALLDEAPAWEFVFYRRPDLGLDWDDDDGEGRIRWVDVDPDPPRSADGTLQRIVEEDPDRLDWLLVPNPVVERRGFALPEPVPGGPRLAAVVHDLIPAIFPRHYLDAPGLAAEYFRDLDRLRAYDLLLANSEATARDVRGRLGVPARRVVGIGAASDPTFFRPGDDPADDRVLSDLGIDGSYVYYLGNVDWRKNVLGLVDAYTLLPSELRGSHRLVLTFGANDWFRRVLAERVEALGLGDRVLATGPVSDEAARALHRRAALFLSPSLYEGFGLPILEAMLCGAAVVVADNSSQPEVAGPSGVLAPTGDPAAWAEIIAGLLLDPSRIESLRKASLRQASRFSWAESARRLRAAIESAPDPAHFHRRTALVPLPTRSESGYDAGAATIFEDMARAPRVVVFAETESARFLPPLPTLGGWHDKGLLGRVLPALGRPAVLYVVDTLGSPDELIKELERHPGAVAFANGGLRSWSDLFREASDDASMESRVGRVLALATSVSCRSEWLLKGLAAIDPGSRGRLHVIPADSLPLAS